MAAEKIGTGCDGRRRSKSEVRGVWPDPGWWPLVSSREASSRVDLLTRVLPGLFPGFHGEDRPNPDGRPGGQSL